MSETMPRGVEPGHASLLEIGGIDLTCEIALNGSAVVEPLPWHDFLLDAQVEKVGNPHVVWVQGHGRGCDALPQLQRTAEQQIAAGGLFVYKEKIHDAFWDTSLCKSLLAMHPHKFQEVEDVRVLRIGQRVGDCYLAGAECEQETHVTTNSQVSEARAGAPREHPAKEIQFDPSVPKHVQAALGRLHQNLGHPSAQDMTRHLRFAGAESGVIEACKSLRCEVCERNRHTAAPRPATLPSLLDMNQLVSVDVFHVFDSERVRHELLSVIDRGTTFHLVCRLEGHGGEDFARQFTQLWGNVFGAPGTISADLESGLQVGVSKYAELHGCRLRSPAGQAHWQQGVVEHHGLWFQEILKRVIDEKSITADDIDLAVQAVNSAKNELRRKHGFSPNQAVFGRDPKSPEELCSGVDEQRFIEFMTHDKQRQREVSIRTAFFRTQLDSKLRRSLLQQARVKRGDYKIGELVRL